VSFEKLAASLKAGAIDVSLLKLLAQVQIPGAHEAFLEAVAEVNDKLTNHGAIIANLREHFISLRVMDGRVTNCVYVNSEAYNRLAHFLEALR